MALPLDPLLVRAHFPAFSEPALNGQAFFENAGGSFTCRQVLDRLEHYYRATKVQPYYGFGASEAAGAAMDLAYERLALALNVGADWIHIGPSTSANTYTLGHAFGQSLLPGDVVVVTNQDHEANAGAWRRLEAMGALIREWRVDPQTGHLDPSELDTLLDGPVKLVSFPHCSNIVGEINPVQEICAKIAAAGALSVVDGVSYAPHGLPDVGSMGADIYLFSAYKVFGPHQGVMAIRPGVAQSLPNQGHFFNNDQPRKRLVPAGPDHAQVAALAGVADYLEVVAGLAGPGLEMVDPFRRAHAAMRAQEIALMTPLLDWLSQSNRLRLIGPTSPDDRAPTIAVALDVPGASLVPRLARHGMMVGGGHFYSYRLLQGLGIDPSQGVLRMSLVHYNSPEEVERLIAALDAELG